MAKKILDALTSIQTRRSIRKYKDFGLPWDYIGKVIEAAKTAPSAGNLQNWKFIIVTDKDARKGIAEACAQQYWMAHAPVHLVVCALPFRAQQYYGIRGERLYSIQNTAAAVTNMLIAANALGIGACWVSYFDENQLRTVMGIPDYATPHAVVTLGYADESPPKPVQYTIEHCSFFESYGNRIKDLDMTLGYYGNWLQRKIRDHTADAKEKIKKLASKDKDQ